MKALIGGNTLSVAVLTLVLAHTTTGQSIPGSTLALDDFSVQCGQYQIPDTDRDTIPDAVETNADADNDGTPNYLDIDSDNDGLPDAFEAGLYIEPWHIGGYTDPGSGCVSRQWGASAYNYNGQTTIDYDGSILIGGRSYPFPYDLDGNGVADVLRDANENNVADFLENAPAVYTLDTDPCIPKGGFTDTDRDLIADVHEGDSDTDNDGIPNYLDTDSDGDGLSDYWERKFASSGDDYDYDGIAQEADVNNRDRSVACILMDLPDPADKDGNGVFDYLESVTYTDAANDPCAVYGGGTDTDGDWIIDSIETDADADSDGIPNYLDLDSDNDGIPDREEYDHAFADVLRYGKDYDGDGVIYKYDIDYTNRDIACLPLTNPAPDFQNDGVPDFLTPDSDGDTLLDGDEKSYHGGLTLDADRDGLSDKVEVDLGTDPGNADTDGGGAYDDWEVLLGSDPADATDDADLPIDLDIDNDGIADALEGRTPGEVNRDSDGDGRSDTQEAGLPDVDNNGVIDDQTDANLNGIADVGEGLTVLPDFDGDSVPDMLDVDSDNDGVGDQFEFSYFSLPEGYAIDVNDVDGDGLLNMFDLDSDNDGIFDINETGITTYTRDKGMYNFVEDIVRDNDNDGRVDDMQDDDSDGIPDHIDHTYRPDEPDIDQDGIIDSADYDQLDSPGQTQTDAYGYVTVTPTIFDADRNGIEDSFQPNRHGDGGFDFTVRIAPAAEDTDQDGIPPILDSDDNVAFVMAVPAVVTPPVNQPTPSPGAALEMATDSGGSGGGGFYMWALLLFLGLGKNKRLSVLLR